MEPDTALARLAVERAMRACRLAQGQLASVDTVTKHDLSPVTVADLAAQAVVCATLAAELGTGFTMVAEEDPETVRGDVHLARSVARLVSHGLDRPIEPEDVPELLGLGRSAASGGAAPTSRFWTLDPIDGTKGFLRGEQYAVALARLDHGKVTLGVLGCPNLPNADGSTGALVVASDDGCRVITDTGTSPAQVAAPATLAEARLCESVETGHSDQGQSARIAALLGITAEPHRIDSQCKYAAVARGDASIYLRLPTSATYRENIWDHAAGVLAVQRAGGTVTDVTGAPLDFSHGARLEHNRGVVATDGRFHDEVLAAVDAVLRQDR